ncbi:MAG: type II toxin-antitoxin system RelE/ParE family toxin [Oscillospiraceae bacterium]|nr:type II toxin-antitoxin system RelE/ParE family toxin [Oscillospiraceae bacterium]MCL2250224.1 type II toxin-antitoxin system RelE/ParE family toxin [Oscillospiraceae bacterium]
METYRIGITDLAKQDILDIATYITYELQEPTIAAKTVNVILDTIYTLEKMPNRIGLAKGERLAEKGIRPLYVKNYTIFFRVDEAMRVVYVVRVLYSRRDWESLL